MKQTIKKLLLLIFTGLLLINPAIALTPQISNIMRYYGGIKFDEPFSVNYIPAADSTWYNNAFNKWDIFKYRSGYVDGSQLYVNTSGPGTNTSFVKIKRTREGYNLNRNFDLRFKFFMEQGDFSNYTPYNHEYISVSIGGNIGNASYAEILYGLEFRIYNNVSVNGNFYIYNNGTYVATPHTNIVRGNWYYVLIKKRGSSISTGLDTSPPVTTTSTVSMTDKTSLSNALIISLSCAGHNDYWGGARLDDISIKLY